MAHIDPTVIIPAGLIAFVGMTLVYSGICGLIRRDVWVPAERFGGRVREIKGTAARVVGFVFLVLGGVILCVIIMSVYQTP